MCLFFLCFSGFFDGVESDITGLEILGAGLYLKVNVLGLNVLNFAFSILEKEGNAVIEEARAFFSLCHFKVQVAAIQSYVC